MKTILKALVGSRAQGTENENSDYDYRYVMLDSTSNILKYAYRPKYPSNIAGEDINFWELQRFIDLSLHGNPSTLEVLKTEYYEATEEGEELRKLFPCLLQRKKIWGAHRGFASHQRKVMESQESTRRNKSASHYLRVLYSGIYFLKTGDLQVKSDRSELLKEIKLGNVSYSDVLFLGQNLEKELDEALEASCIQEHANLDIINEFLLKIRKENW